MWIGCETPILVALPLDSYLRAACLTVQRNMELWKLSCGVGNRVLRIVTMIRELIVPIVVSPPTMPTRKRNSKSKEQCLALEDEETRCIQPPTHGSPPERCETHDGQYRNMTKKYKDASKIVDEMQMGSNIPTKAEILRYTDFHSTLQKARWMRKYVEAIRVEKNGREIHHRRFFLKSM